MIRLFSRIFRREDELVGRWETSNEGGLQQLSGNRLELKENGTGVLSSWGWGEDEPYNYSNEIEWNRIGKKIIKIRVIESKDFEIVNYKIENYIGPYGEAYDKLFDPNFDIGVDYIKGIWRIPGELFRTK